MLAAGTPAKEIARRYGLVGRSVSRHAASHLPAAVQQAAKQDDEARDLDVLKEVKALHKLSLLVLTRAERTNDLRTMLGAIREARETLELVAKLLGDLDERPQVNVLVMAQWIEIRAVLMNALKPYPEARTAVARALLESETDARG
jgi:hypothetical protein